MTHLRYAIYYVYSLAIHVLMKISYCLLVYALPDACNLVKHLALKIEQHPVSKKLFGSANIHDSKVQRFGNLSPSYTL